MHSPMGAELVDPSVDYWVDREFTTSEPFFELQLNCINILKPKMHINYKCLSPVVHDIFKLKFVSVLEHLFFFVNLKNKNKWFAISKDFQN